MKNAPTTSYSDLGEPDLYAHASEENKGHPKTQLTFAPKVHVKLATDFALNFAMDFGHRVNGAGRGGGQAVFNQIPYNPIKIESKSG